MLQMSAYCFGLIVLSCLAFLFLPIARGSILLRLIDIPFEHATRYHVWLGNLIFFLVTMHGLCYMIVWTVRGIIPSEVSSHLYLFTDVHMSLQLCILWSACFWINLWSLCYLQDLGIGIYSHAMCIPPSTFLVEGYIFMIHLMNT